MAACRASHPSRLRVGWRDGQERTEQTLSPAIDAGGYAPRRLPVSDQPDRHGMARPSGRLEVRRRAGGLVQRRQRATGSADRIAAIWMGAWHARNVLRGALAGSAMVGSVVAGSEVRPACAISKE